MVIMRKKHEEFLYSIYQQVGSNCFAYSELDTPFPPSVLRAMEGKYLVQKVGQKPNSDKKTALWQITLRGLTYIYQNPPEEVRA